MNNDLQQAEEAARAAAERRKAELKRAECKGCGNCECKSDHSAAQTRDAQPPRPGDEARRCEWCGEIANGKCGCDAEVEIDRLRARVAELEECIKTRDLSIEMANKRSDLQKAHIAELESINERQDARIAKLRTDCAKLIGFAREFRHFAREFGQRVNQLQSDRADLVRRTIEAARQVAGKELVKSICPNDDAYNLAIMHVFDAIRAIDQSKLLEGK